MKRRDLLEVLDDRYRRVSTIITRQLPLNAWHDSIGDAILDRIVHNAYQITLSGDSMRKIKNSLTNEDTNPI